MPKVMVVDDDADIRKLLSVWLRSGGFEVVIAVDGYQAVQVARSERPDVVLLDISIPAATGYVVKDRLDRMPSVASIPVIYMSADARAERKALASGGATFLAKPLDKDVVIKTIRDVCQPA